MPYKRPEPKRLVITSIGTVQTIPMGNCFVECETSLGIVAFWGSKMNLVNIWSASDTCGKQVQSCKLKRV